MMIRTRYEGWTSERERERERSQVEKKKIFFSDEG
jgi:hypothetical protein